MTSFRKWPKLVTMHGLGPWQNSQFKSKIKIWKKHRKNDCRTTLQLFCAKNSMKKHPIFEKWQVFENGQNWSKCMGYSVCKMLSLGPKLKFEKTSGKRPYKHIRVVLCKKRLEQTPNLQKMTSFRKWPKLVTMHGL